MASSKGFSFESLVIAIFFSTFDMMVITPILPFLMKEFHLSMHWAVWAISLHLAFFSFSLPIFESMAAQRGRIKVWTISLLFVIIGSLISMSSSDWFGFMCGRVLQAMGTAGVLPYVSIQVRRKWNKKTHREQVKWFMIWGLGFVLNPIFSAGISYVLGWRSIFLFPLGLALVVGILSQKWSPVDLPRRVRTANGESTIFFGLIILFLLTAVTSTDWSKGFTGMIDKNILPLWIVAIGLVIPLLMVERRQEYPFFELHIFGNWRLWMLYLQAMLAGFIWMFLVIIPSWVVFRYNLSYFAQGGVLSFILLFSLLALPMVQFFNRRFNVKVISLIGFFLAAFSLLLLIQVYQVNLFFIALSILGISLTFALMAPVHIPLFKWVEPVHLRNGLLALGMFRAAGGALGLAVMARVFSLQNPLLLQWIKMESDSGRWIEIGQSQVLILVACVAFMGMCISLAIPHSSIKKS